MPRRWVSDSALLSPLDLEGRTVGIGIDSGTLLTRDVLVPASELSPTEREIAVNVDAVTGVAGRVEPGDFVDIYAVFADVPGLTRQVRVLVRNARIVSVGGQRTVQREVDVDVRQQEVLPVTLALDPQDTLAVSYASAFAQEVRLVRLPTGTTERRGDENELYDAGDLGGDPVPEGHAMTVTVVVGCADQGLAYELRSRLTEIADVDVAYVAESTTELTAAVLRLDPQVVLLHDRLGAGQVADVMRDLSLRRPVHGHSWSSPGTPSGRPTPRDGRGRPRAAGLPLRLRGGAGAAGQRRGVVHDDAAADH
jgi:pilus assembly protein CpaB